MSQIKDKLLIRSFLLTRSEYVFKQIYRAYSEDIYRLIFFMMNRDKEASEDILQETWIRSIQNLAGFKFNSSLKTWLCGIALNCCREYNRKRNFYVEGFKENDMPFDIQDSLETKLDIVKALSFLPEGYKEILILHDMEGMKHKEISTLLGITEGTSKSQLFNARRSIKKLLN